ncbi:hypothetical protein Plhal703r1_c13g0065521 [Plasmopara halstedii]
MGNVYIYQSGLHIPFTLHHHDFTTLLTSLTLGEASSEIVSNSTAKFNAQDSAWKGVLAADTTVHLSRYGNKEPYIEADKVNLEGPSLKIDNDGLLKSQCENRLSQMPWVTGPRAGL